MEPNLQTVLAELRQLEKSIAEQLKKREMDLFCTLRSGRVVFEKEVQKQHRALKKSIHGFLSESSFLSLLVSPMVYAMLIPALLLDFFTFFYQWICFPVYGIPRVVRSEYIVFDRHMLKYLNWIERINCAYCGYFNGLMAYVSEVASLTEQYFCPIKHALSIKGLHERHDNFLPFGDAVRYHQKLEDLRSQLRQMDSKNLKPET